MLPIAFTVATIAVLSSSGKLPDVNCLPYLLKLQCNLSILSHGI